MYRIYVYWADKSGRIEYHETVADSRSKADSVYACVLEAHWVTQAADDFVVICVQMMRDRGCGKPEIVRSWGEDRLREIEGLSECYGLLDRLEAKCDAGDFGEVKTTYRILMNRGPAVLDRSVCEDVLVYGMRSAIYMKAESARSAKQCVSARLEALLNR